MSLLYPTAPDPRSPGLPLACPAPLNPTQGNPALPYTTRCCATKPIPYNHSYQILTYLSSPDLAISQLNLHFLGNPGCTRPYPPPPCPVRPSTTTQHTTRTDFLLPSKPINTHPKLLPPCVLFHASHHPTHRAFGFRWCEGCYFIAFAQASHGLNVYF